MDIFWGLLIPFLGTMFGSGTVFLMRNKMNKKIESLFSNIDTAFLNRKTIYKVK